MVPSIWANASLFSFVASSLILQPLSVQWGLPLNARFFCSCKTIPLAKAYAYLHACSLLHAATCGPQETLLYLVLSFTCKNQSFSHCRTGNSLPEAIYSFNKYLLNMYNVSGTLGTEDTAVNKNKKTSLLWWRLYPSAGSKQQTKHVLSYSCLAAHRTTRGWSWEDEKQPRCPYRLVVTEVIPCLWHDKRSSHHL